MNYQSEDDSDEAVVHKAMGFLRRRIIENNPKLDDFFYAPEEIKLSDQKQFVGPLLYKAVWMHLNNEFGSRHLIEDMYSLVYSISYPDLRLFLTSAAQQNIASHKITDSGGIVPDNILPRDQRGKLVVAVADNWNLNERTVDGKRTTHAMTSMLVSSAPAESTRIPRLPKATSRMFDSQSLPGLQELFFSVCNLKT
ncbi:hypothetical protein DPMN_053330 [Dreissena polymorpha]|uniref:Uncharacterized protein n=1 Tax=Dreissena polymorpha TaxID=45954 RepID=A0A9D4CME5_DREPO|nr:hypothetical protein DPMN_053330 [Dreissena polymorpha]